MFRRASNRAEGLRRSRTGDGGQNWGRDVTLGEVRERTGIGRCRTVMPDLLCVGRSYGLRGREIKVDVEGLHDLPTGAILCWEFQRYVVLEECG